MTAPGSTIQELVTPKQPLHVLTLTPFYPVTGDDAQGCFVAEPLAELARLGVANTVRAVRPFYRGGPTAGGSTIAARWVRFFSLPGGRGLSNAGAFLFARLLFEIRRLQGSKPVHVIHAHSALPCGHAATLLSRELKIPFVVTVHGLDAFSSRQVEGRAGEWCARISQSVYRSARSVICISEKVRDQVIEGAGPRVETTVIYNGVDPEMFSPADTEDAPVILSVGNLIPIKGHELLLRAFAAIQNQFPRLSLEIIGDGPERPRLQKLANELGIAAKISFRGRQGRRQVADAMRRATLFALPSRYEGLGCVYLEAMSAGKPVIACRKQGIEEVVQQGVNGYLIGADDLQELTETLAGLLSQPDLRRKMGHAARQTVLQGYTLGHQAARLLRLYRECQA
ncbi:MAG: glycosyltransferase [Acidobacteriia bacterium]|nr:glycosyltransferase [Terriglobia bacterium]